MKNMCVCGHDKADAWIKRPLRPVCEKCSGLPTPLTMFILNHRLLDFVCSLIQRKAPASLKTDAKY